MLKLIVLIFILLSSTALAQEEPETVTLPDHVMRQVLTRILRANFKSPAVRRTVPVSDRNVKREWLPNIPNIDFVLVTDEETLDHKKGAFLIEPVTLQHGVYTINVGWGDRKCSASGTTWQVTLTSGWIGVEQTSAGWGRGCGGNTPPIVRGLKLGDVSPNEIPGYRFFTIGKLKKIRLGISTPSEMTAIFGDSCEEPCRVDDNWTLRAEYFDDSSEKWETTLDEVTTKWEETAKPEVIGKLKAVHLRPTGSISFRRVKFGRAFSENTTYSMGCDPEPDGSFSSVHTSIDTYTDGYGLEYEVYDEETFNNLRNPDPNEKKAEKGDLVGISYQVPAVIRHKVYLKRFVSGEEQK